MQLTILRFLADAIDFHNKSIKFNSLGWKTVLILHDYCCKKFSYKKTFKQLDLCQHFFTKVINLNKK